MFKTSTRRIAATIASVIFTLLAPGGLVAEPGDIDCTFGQGGSAVVDFGGSEVFTWFALQANDEIIAVALDAGTIQIARLLADGSVATDFGTGGLSTANLDLSGLGGVAIDSQDRIIIVGSRIEAGDVQVFVARFTTAGTLDTSFATDGWITFSFAAPGASDFGSAVAVDEVDRILVGGSNDANGPTFGQSDIALARLTPSGVLDPTFGTGGIVVTNSGGTIDENVLGMALTGDAIAVIGANGIPGSRDVIVVRYNAADGSLDQSFDGDGIRILDLGNGGDDFGRSIAIDTSGRIVGVSTGPSGNPAIFRLTAAGTLDPSFGTGGIVVTEFAPGAQDIPQHVAIQADGKVILSGWVPFDFALLRLTSDGVLDPTFSDDGRLVTNLGGQERGTGFAIQQDGRVIVGGSTTTGANPFNFAAVRYLNDGHLNGATTTTIDLDTPDPSTVGQAVMVQFTIGAVAGTPTGDVVISNGMAGCTGTVAAGSCSLSLPALGTSTLEARYQGDGTFCSSTHTELHTVIEGSTVTVITADFPDPSVVGQPVTVEFTVSSTDGTPSGQVAVGDGQGAACMGMLVGGAGSCVLTPTATTPVSLIATYLGDGVFAKSTGVEPHEVMPAATSVTIISDDPDPSLPGQLVTVTIAVAAQAPASGTPTGSVTVGDDAGEVCTVPLTAGVGSCALASTTAGTRNWTASYSGDANNLSSTAVTAHQVLDIEAPTVVGVNARPDGGTGTLAPCSSTRDRIEELALVFSETLRTGGGVDAADNLANYALLAAGDDRSLDTTACGPPVGDDVALALAGVIYSVDQPEAPQSTATLAIESRLENGIYRLFACASMVDNAGNALDGDRNGNGGDDFVLDFRVATANLLANSHFDCNLDGWIASPANTSEITYSALDTDGAAHSGSGLLDNTGGLVLALGQCATEAGGLTGDYQLSATFRVDALPGIEAGIVRGCDLYQNASCSGTPTLSATASGLLPDTADAFVEQAHTFEVPLGTLSVFCDVTSGSADASAWDLYVDQVILQRTPIFSDGFESGGTSAWTVTVP